MQATPRILALILLGLIPAPLLAPAPGAQEAAPSGPVPPAQGARIVPGTRPLDPEARQGPGLIIPPGVGDDGTDLVFEQTRVAANGISLRNVTSGAINLVGMPLGSRVVRAYLYWQWVSMPPAPVAGLHDTLYLARVPPVVPLGAPPLGGFPAALPTKFKPKRVRGTLIGSGADPCWLGGANFTFRADVTRHVKRAQTFLLWLPTGSQGMSDWSDPFAPFPPQIPPLCEGASLVVVYENPMEPMGTTLIYDAPLASTMFAASPGLTWTLVGFVHPGAEARWINIGGDGQTGGGYFDAFGPGLEVTTFLGPTLAGGGAGVIPFSLYNDSDWNGSANKPLGQLWDTSGHDVTPYLPAGATSATISVFDPSGGTPDCLVPAANVIWVR